MGVGEDLEPRIFRQTPIVVSSTTIGVCLKIRGSTTLDWPEFR